MGSDKKIIILIFIPVTLLALLNLVTVFTPEVGFDALWYHLTLPKLWLFKHQWYFDGGLLYYSVMPRLTETLFIPLIALWGHIGPKMLLYLSGLGTGFVIWKTSRKMEMDKVSSALTVSLFYCTWLVSWQSGSAYIDLFRTFLESVALFFLVSGSWLKGGLALGLSVGTKWLSLGSLAIYGLVFNPLVIPLGLVLSSPWMLIAHKYTQNPFYPLFEPFLHNSFSHPLSILKRLLLLPFSLTIPFDDFISPMVFILVLLSIFSLFGKSVKVKKIALVGLLGAVFSLSLEPPSSRYFLPFFPAIIISAVSVVSNQKKIVKNVFLGLCLASSVLVLGARVLADIKYLPFVLGKQTVTEYLTQHADRLPDTFIDSDGYVSQNIPRGSRVLIDKLHNLYYFPYNFDHTSWAEDELGYDYLITVGTVPSTVNGELVHTNNLGIQVYKLNK